MAAAMDEARLIKRLADDTGRATTQQTDEMVKH
jgi:hypothetical protein